MCRSKRLDNAPVRAKENTEIPPNASKAIAVKMPREANGDVSYLFQPFGHNQYLPFGCYVLKGIVNGNQGSIIVSNLSDTPLKVLKNTRVGRISTMDLTTQQSAHWSHASDEMSSMFLPPCGDSQSSVPCYNVLSKPSSSIKSSADPDPILPPKGTDDTPPSKFVPPPSPLPKSIPVDIPSPPSSQRKPAPNKMDSTQWSSSTASTSTIDAFFSKMKNLSKAQAQASSSDPNSPFRADLVYINGVDISDEQVDKLRSLLRKHEKLFRDELGFAVEPEEDLLRIPFIPGAEREIPSLKPYRLSPDEKKVVDEVFDRQKKEGRLVDAKGSPCGWQVFVVKRGGKWRAVVDLRPLNSMVVKDAYPLPLQDEMLNCINGAEWLSLLDMLMCFYQRGVHPDDWWKLAISTHRGHEMFTVAPMGFVNSVAHQQRYMDRLLRRYKWRVAMCYLDDIVVFSATFDQHLIDLDEVLTVLEEAGLTLKPAKCLVGFHSLKILGKVVDKFGMSTTEERMEAISTQKWPTTLLGLDTFLGQCTYVCHHIPYYSQMASPLQHLKTRLFKKAPPTMKRPERRRYADKIKLDLPTPAQKKSFELLKWAIGKFALGHIRHDKPFVAYVDGSLEVGIGVALFQYIDDRTEVPDVIDHTLLKPVMFLSRELKSSEIGYWPTELETGGLVWCIQKLRHLVQSSKFIVYTDHKAAETISKMKSLQTTAPGRRNLRLQNWSVFMSQFWGNLDVRYVKGIDNVMADALSRLRREVKDLTSEDRLASELRTRRESADDEDIHAFNIDEFVSASLVQLEDEFKDRLVQAYADDKHFAPIIKVIRESITPSTSQQTDLVGRPRSPYRLDTSTGLLYYEDSIDFRLRLCIPRKCLKEVLHLAHDSDGHFKVAKTYARAIAGFFAPGLLRQIKRYIAFCPRCQINRTLTDKPHGELIPIKTPPIPFHTLSMDFIVALPSATMFGHGDEAFDSILTVTDKFAKLVKLIPGKSTYSAMDWANLFWSNVYPDWGLPNAIISDRDPKFLSDFWKGLFAKADTKILASTAYHPQTDGQSERTNQTVEVALRHYINSHQDDWPSHLPIIQAAINTSVSATTKFSPLQLLYGFNPRHTLDLLKGKSAADNWASDRELFRKEAADSIVLAQQQMIRFTDPKRKHLAFAVGDRVYLRLSNDKAHGYTLPANIKLKLSQQRVGPFKVLELIGKNAYKLQLPANWKIHNVISIVYLDPAPRGTDPFDREIPPPPPVVKNADDPDALWEVESIIKKRTIGRLRSKKVEYLVRWKGWGAEYDDWIPEDQLYTCPDLVKEFEVKQGNVEWTPPKSWEGLMAADSTADEDDFMAADEIADVNENDAGEYYIGNNRSPFRSTKTATRPGVTPSRPTPITSPHPLPTTPTIHRSPYQSAPSSQRPLSIASIIPLRPHQSIANSTTNHTGDNSSHDIYSNQPAPLDGTHTAPTAKTTEIESRGGINRKSTSGDKEGFGQFESLATALGESR